MARKAEWPKPDAADVWNTACAEVVCARLNMRDSAADQESLFDWLKYSTNGHCIGHKNNS